MFNLVEIPHLAAARAGDSHAFSNLTEPYRRELQLHCYRLLGSLHEAEDLVQETLLRAWRRLDSYEGRAPFRAWLYKIATNACLDTMKQRTRRALPLSLFPAANPAEPLAPPTADPIWLEPFPDEQLPEMAAASPEARYALHESISLAFLAALQLLPPRQRAVLILRDVLDWRASEVAELLEMTVSAANSALHRARTILTQNYHVAEIAPAAADEKMEALLKRYMQAWESADIPALIALLKEDATLSMPPSSSWYHGKESIAAFLSAVPFAGAAPGRWRTLATRANGQPAVAFYQRDGASNVCQPFAIQVLALDRAWIREMTTFINPALFSYFNLPAELK